MNQITKPNQEQAVGLRARREMHERLDGNSYQVMAETILGSYPAANLGDPDTYIRALRELLMGYPAKVALAIASPRSGIVTRCKFPPSMAEVADMAGPLVAELQREIDRSDEQARQLEYSTSSPSTPEERAEAIARWRRVKAEMLSGMEAAGKTRGKPRFPQSPPGEAILAYMQQEQAE